MLKINEWKDKIKEKIIKSVIDNFISKEKIDDNLFIKGVFFIMFVGLGYICISNGESSQSVPLFLIGFLLLVLSIFPFGFGMTDFSLKAKREKLINKIKNCIKNEDKSLIDIVYEIEEEVSLKIFKDKNLLNKISEEDVIELISILNEEEKKEIKNFFKSGKKDMCCYDDMIDFIKTL
jgi:hypothetical protein